MLLRRLVHGAMILWGWWVYFWCWRLVTTHHPDAGLLGTVVAGSIILGPTITLSWVAHNVGLYRRRGARRTVRQVSPDLESLRDFNGRRLCGHWMALAASRRITIRNVATDKCFASEGRESFTAIHRKDLVSTQLSGAADQLGSSAAARRR